MPHPSLTPRQQWQVQSPPWMWTCVCHQWAGRLQSQAACPVCLPSGAWGWEGSLPIKPDKTDRPPWGTGCFLPTEDAPCVAPLPSAALGKPTQDPCAVGEMAQRASASPRGAQLTGTRPARTRALDVGGGLVLCSRQMLFPKTSPPVRCHVKKKMAGTSQNDATHTVFQFSLSHPLDTHFEFWIFSPTSAGSAGRGCAPGGPAAMGQSWRSHPRGRPETGPHL